MEQMMEDFEGLTIDELGVSEWPLMDIGDGLLLFINDSGESHFDFMCARWYSETCGTPSVARYEVVISGTVMFDGIRHLYFGSEKTDNHGYFYYPNIERIKKALDALDEQVKIRITR